MRRYDEQIQVRVQATGPVAFLWRRQLYVVRQVLGCWRERDAWWEHIDRADHMREQRIWRVEASSGRMAGAGVYDLAEAVSVSEAPVSEESVSEALVSEALVGVGAGPVVGARSGGTRTTAAGVRSADAQGDAGEGWRLLRAVD